MLDYSLGLLIEIYSRDVSMSQPSTFISTAEEFISYISYKTWQYLLTHQGLLSPLSLRICGNYTLMLNTPTGWGLWTISVLVCSCFSFETRQLSDSLRDDHLSVSNMSKHAVLSCLDLSKLREQLTSIWSTVTSLIAMKFHLRLVSELLRYSNRSSVD